jgi:hypothetical protein
MSEPEKSYAETLLDMLDKAEKVETVTDTMAFEALEVFNDSQGVVGRVVLAGDKISRGRKAVARLTDPEREKKPGAFELAYEGWKFLNGE